MSEIIVARVNVGDDRKQCDEEATRMTAGLVTLDTRATATQAPGGSARSTFHSHSRQHLLYHHVSRPETTLH